MIGMLTGIVRGVRGSALLLDVGGVGYLVHVIPRLLHDAPEWFDKNDPSNRGILQTRLYTYQHFREDSTTLYGFATAEEVVAFEDLLDVKGMGPRAALKVLSHATIGDVRQLAAAKDTKRLAAIPGIGAKMAESLCEKFK